ncbi:HAD-IA family hydrolase [Candidatus Pseudothioglobus singularis]|jgi:beta-phosphoglucomutase-like phosphatase (HAD superfamily)|nr:HAD-IA family hydrolase [Candidatus Pseudothioglobus singularis]MDC3216438.1 HAD-IA family hydrolase [Candidatus Pseudothioglobus singularis]
MNYKAILFGSIGTLLETSELQRISFNQAFSENGLDWNWNQAQYQNLLKKSGGRQRIEDFAAQQGVEVDAKKLHDEKTKIFDNLMVSGNVLLRPGVANLIEQALNKGIKLAFVTSTSKDNVDAVFQALKNQLNRSNFSFIGNDKMISNTKPQPDIYLKALSELNLVAQDCIAIEDTEVSMQSALAASIKCIGFPGAFAKDNDFSSAILVTDNLSFNDLP